MINETGRHAIKAVVTLARHPEGVHQGAKAIAEEIKAPANYLGKLLQQLANEGLLTSTKGRGGGFSLARPASEITLFDILDPIQHLSRERQCILGWKKCSNTKPCAMHHSYAPIREQMEVLYQDTTIADVLSGAIIE